MAQHNGLSIVQIQGGAKVIVVLTRASGCARSQPHFSITRHRKRLVKRINTYDVTIIKDAGVCQVRTGVYSANIKLLSEKCLCQLERHGFWWARFSVQNNTIDSYFKRKRSGQSSRHLID